MKVQARLVITDDRGDAFMGIGLVWLLERIDRFHSIAQAARDMGLSYVKALRILKQLEANLGQPLLARSKGGARRGGSDLTPLAHRLVREFERLRREVQACAERKFQRCEKALKHRPNKGLRRQTCKTPTPKGADHAQ